MKIHKTAKNLDKKIALLWFLILMVALNLSGCSNSSANKTEINKDMIPPPIDTSSLVTPEPVINDEQINKKNYDAIKQGMSQFEVEVLIAGTNTLINSKKAENGEKIETYRWETPDSKRSIEVTFQNEKVIDKKSDGLK